jgi:hypothetical protein
MYFGTKSYLKSNHYHTAKHLLRRALNWERHNEKMEGVSFSLIWVVMLRATSGVSIGKEGWLLRGRHVK